MKNGHVEGFCPIKIRGSCHQRWPVSVSGLGSISGATLRRCSEKKTVVSLKGSNFYTHYANYSPVNFKQVLVIFNISWDPAIQTGWNMEIKGNGWVNHNYWLGVSTPEKNDGKYGKIIQPCYKPPTRSNMLSWRYVGSGWSYFNGWSQWIQYFPKGQAISMMTWHFYHIQSGYLEGLSIPYCILICYNYCYYYSVHV